ncbi:MAG: M28 family metallopeptidase, partial [Marinicella sp.]
PGAEDNASGCSGVLEMANVISQYETEASIYFMCFIEEESGLLGSKDVVTYLTNQGDISKVKTMINLDMISYRGPGRNTAIAGTNSTSYQSLANDVAANGNLYTEVDWQVNLNMCCTDFVSFGAAGIPAVTTNQPDISSYAGYHTTQDLATNLDPTLAAGVIKANLVTLIDLVGVDFNSSDLIFADGFE